jgi:hypothetical protein
VSHVCTGWASCSAPLSLHIAPSQHIAEGEFASAALALNYWLQDVADNAAEGTPVYMVAHNGHSCDWRYLTLHLLEYGMSLPTSITKLCCSKKLFVSDKKAVLGRRWSMNAIYAARFDGADIKDAHTAAADVR